MRYDMLCNLRSRLFFLETLMIHVTSLIAEMRDCSTIEWLLKFALYDLQFARQNAICNFVCVKSQNTRL